MKSKPKSVHVQHISGLSFTICYIYVYVYDFCCCCCLTLHHRVLVNVQVHKFIIFILIQGNFVRCVFFSSFIRSVWFSLTWLGSIWFGSMVTRLSECFMASIVNRYTFSGNWTIFVHIKSCYGIYLLSQSGVWVCAVTKYSE